MRNIGICFVSSAHEVEPEFAFELAHRAEEVGVHSFWVNDRITYDNLQPLTLLAAAAAVTRKIKLGTSILLAALHHPVLLAKTVATISFLARGRLIIGIGCGGSRSEFDAVELPFEGRGTRVAEQMQLMKRLWREKDVTHNGRFFNLRDVTVGPQLSSSYQPPFWMGGGAEPVLRRIGQMADGYICSTASLPKFPTIWQKISEYALKSGRNPDEITRAAITYLAIDNNKTRAIEACEAYLMRYYGKVTLDVSTHMVIGSPEECRSRLHSFFEQGVQTLILRIVVPDLRQVDLLGEKILPQLDNC